MSILLKEVDALDIIDRFRGINFWYCSLAVCVMFLLAFVHAARWVAIIRANGGEMSFTTSLKLVFVGYFFNQALPSSIGGDAIRIWQAHRSGLSLVVAINTVVIDRLIALAAMLIMTSVALPWLMEIVVESGLRWVIVLVIIGGVCGFAALLSLNRLPEFICSWKVLRPFLQLSEDAKKILPNSGGLTLALSVGIHLGVALVVFMIASALNVTVGLINCIILVPLVMLVSLFPVSIAGWGIREGAMVVALGLVQIPQSDAISVSIIFGLLFLITSLPGGVLWWRTNHNGSNQVDHLKI